MGYFVSFLLKVWVHGALEEAAGENRGDAGAMRDAWRGQIQHVRSGDVLTFASHEEMLEFIWAHLPAGAERPEGGEL